jgi:hypothetical protein
MINPFKLLWQWIVDQANQAINYNPIEERRVFWQEYDEEAE